MKCQFCKEPKEDNIHFDKPAEHLIIVMDITGTTHVHGPFGNEYVMRKMTDALVAEMAKHDIIYNPPKTVLPGD